MRYELTYKCGELEFPLVDKLVGENLYVKGKEQKPIDLYTKMEVSQEVVDFIDIVATVTQKYPGDKVYGINGTDFKIKPITNEERRCL